MRRRLVLVGVAAVLAIWAIVAALLLVRVASDLRAGRDAANRAKDHLGPDEVADRVPLADLRTAAKRFDAAHDRVGALVLRPLRILPVVGRQLSSIDALSDAAATVASAGVDAVGRAGVVFDDPAKAGSERVAQVRMMGEIVDDVAARLRTIDDLGPAHGLVGPLASARHDLSADLADARNTLADAHDGSSAALSLLTGPRRYLVIAANNAEMRAGSGMWLQGGILDAKDGELELGEMVVLPFDADPPTGSVVPTGDLAARWGFLEPGDEWRSLMPSPRFEDSARLAAAMWKAAGRGDVDGVIVVDALGLQAIVEATGPVPLAGGNISAEHVPGYLLHDQYLQFASGNDVGVDNVARREALGALARSAVAAVNEGGYQASTLIRTLGNAIAGRHLLAWSADPVESKGWKAAGMDGALDASSLLVSVLNTGANKLDWFLSVDATLSVKRSDAGWDVAVELQLENRTPDGEPPYVAGPIENTGLAPGEYRGILAVNVPGSARHSRFDGIPALAVAGSDGPTRVVGTVLGLRAGESRRVVLRFSVPGTVDHVVVEPSARMPAVRWRYGSSSWEDTTARTANWRG